MKNFRTVIKPMSMKKKNRKIITKGLIIETYRVSMDIRKRNTTREKTIQVHKQEIYKRQTVTKSVIKRCIKAVKYERMAKL